MVTEGNYLLLDRPEWHAVRLECDAVWHLVTDEASRVERLVARHVAAGRSVDDANEWVRRVDQANADLVEAAAGAADERARPECVVGLERLRRSGRPTAVACGCASNAEAHYLRIRSLCAILDP